MPDDTGLSFSSKGKPSAKKYSKEEKFKKFNPYRRILSDPAMKGYAYLFFTKPILNFESNADLKKAPNGRDLKYNLSATGFFKHLATKDPMGKYILSSLTTPCAVGKGTFKGNVKYNGKTIAEANYVPGKFIPILSNAFESFAPTDTVGRTKETFETRTGFKMIYPGVITDSLAGQLNIEYEESQGLPIIKLHKAWFEYIDLIRKGVIYPHEMMRAGAKVIDYVSSIYYFVTEPDGETISYYAKYTGVFPNNIPYSVFDFHAGQIEVVKPSIQYSYSFKEDMDPEILTDFSRLCELGSINTGGVDNIPVNASKVGLVYQDVYTDSSRKHKVNKVKIKFG